MIWSESSNVPRVVGVPSEHVFAEVHHLTDHPMREIGLVFECAQGVLRYPQVH